jgi:hypothetical protein
MRSEFRGLPEGSEGADAAAPPPQEVAPKSTEKDTPPKPAQPEPEAQAQAQAQTETAQDKAPAKPKRADRRPEKKSAASSNAPEKTAKDDEDGTSSTDKPPRSSRTRSKAKADDEPARKRSTSRRNTSQRAQDDTGQSTAETEAADASQNQVADAPKSNRDDKESIPAIPEGMARIFCNLGRRDGLSAATIKDTISELAGLLPDDLADVSLLARHSFLTVNEEYAEDLIEAVNGERYGSRSIRVEIAH